MTSSKFAQLLQNELILPRDPHLVARFEALLSENFSVDPEEVPKVVEPQLRPVEDWTKDGLLVPRDASVVNASTAADGVNIVEEPIGIGPTTQDAVIVSNGPGDLGTGSRAIVQQSESEAK